MGLIKERTSNVNISRLYHKRIQIREGKEDGVLSQAHPDP